MLVVSAVLVAAVGLAVAVGVIRPVSADNFPGATPERAVPAFWVAVGLHLLLAVTLVLTAMRSKSRSRFSTCCLGVMGLAVLLFGIALADAAFAYHAEGASMRTVAVLLFSCVTADSLGGALIITTAFLRPKATREGLTRACS
jgi:hypothetical protein